jgi:hypothetical protein
MGHPPGPGPPWTAVSRQTFIRQVLTRTWLTWRASLKDVSIVQMSPEQDVTGLVIPGTYLTLIASLRRVEVDFSKRYRGGDIWPNALELTYEDLMLGPLHPDCPANAASF